MKKKMKRLLTGLLTGVLALLGFSLQGCSDDEPLLMYGTPTATHRIKGKVVDSENKSQGLSNIQVVIIPGSEGYYADTLYTDRTGEFSYDRGGGTRKKRRIIYEDTQNGIFKKDSLDIELQQVEKGEGWYQGVYEAEAMIEMEKKGEEENEEQNND